MAKRNTNLKKGTLHFYHDDKGALYTYLKTLELFNLSDFDKLNSRAKAFSKRTTAYLIETNFPTLKAGDYVIDNEKLSLVLSSAEKGKCKVRHIRNIKTPLKEYVWCMIDGAYRLRIYCRYVPAWKGYALIMHTVTNEKGDVVLKKGAKLSTTTRHTYEGWECGLKKIAASTDKTLLTNGFKAKELEAIMSTNGRLRDISFHYVPNGFVKIKSQKLPD